MKSSKLLIKYFVLLIVTVMLFSVLVSCGENNKPENNEENNQETNQDKEQNKDQETSVEMTNSYKQGRNQFKAVTNIELPALDKLVVDEFPYREGSSEYCFDITSGENLNYATYQTFENFFKEKLGACDSGFPKGDEQNGRDAQWTKNGRWYQTMWDATNKAIYINTTTKNPNVNPEVDPSTNPGDEPTSKMTESYKLGRNNFHAISGIWLPEIENLELDADSSFELDKKSAEFIVAGDSNLFATYLSAVKSYLANEPLSDNNNHWKDDYGSFWEWDYADTNNEMHKVTIQMELRQTKIYVGFWFRDYNRITVTTTEGGSVILKRGGRVQENNTSYSVNNTSYDIIATPDFGYEFTGFYVGNDKLSDNSNYTILVSKDVLVEAKFSAIPDNMEESYRKFRKTFFELSEIILPELENVTTDHETINKDEDNQVRDEAQAELVFASSNGITNVYADIKTLINRKYGNPSEDINDAYSLMTQWSIPDYEATIPYRTEILLTYSKNDTSFFVMWRKQPIVIINVSVEGNGTAGFVVINSNYEEELFTKSFEIVDAFHGTLQANYSDLSKEFLGWYVDSQLVSSDIRYTFNYTDVDFTEITFVENLVIYK